MFDLWWRMPGPAHYTSAVIDQLGDGKNVVLCMPKHLPAGIGRAIVKGYMPPHGRRWETLSLGPKQQHEPVEVLFRHFVKTINPVTLRNVRSLVREREFSGRLVWIEGFTKENWSAWCSFLEEYEYQCRAQLSEERTLFCIALVGDVAIEPPNAGISLTHLYWKGVVEDIDMLLYTSVIMPKKLLAGNKRRLAISIISALSLWDPITCELLTQLPLRSLLQPYQSLRKIAEERQWHNTLGTDPWSHGITDEFANQKRDHSAALALAERNTEIERRIWTAQTSILFPLIEERRHEILHGLQGLLSVPFRTKEGIEIADLYDLEIGHIEWLLQKCKREGSNDPRISTFLPQVSKLKYMRNQLAHLRAIDEDQIYI